jgi:hypothetical protein
LSIFCTEIPVDTVHPSSLKKVAVPLQLSVKVSVKTAPDTLREVAVLTGSNTTPVITFAPVWSSVTVATTSPLVDVVIEEKNTSEVIKGTDAIAFLKQRTEKPKARPL